MIAEAIDKILSLAPPSLHTLGGREYSTKNLTPIQTPMPSGVGVFTLSGLCDLIRERLEPGVLDPKAHILHVKDYRTVALIARECDRWGRRLNLIVAEAEKLSGVEPNRFVGSEEFVIGLQSTFVETDDLKYVLGIASNLTSESSINTEDDGITQRATLRSGVALKKEIAVRARVNLRPYRTFREVEQPASDFVFRIRHANGGHQCALFEADGGRWKLDAALTIQRYLAVADLGLPVVA